MEIKVQRRINAATIKGMFQNPWNLTTTDLILSDAIWSSPSQNKLERHFQISKHHLISQRAN